MRWLVVCTVAVLAWTLSIQWVKVPSPGPPSLTRACPSPDSVQFVLWAMENSVLHQVYNDGASLWVDITPTWGRLSGDDKQLLYHSLSCLAQQQDVSLRLVPFLTQETELISK